MPELDDTRIESIIAELDRLVPREGAIVTQELDDGGMSEHCGPFYAGNRLGYLRWGIEMMKVAYTDPVDPAQAGPISYPDISLNYLFLDEEMDNEESVWKDLWMFIRNETVTHHDSLWPKQCKRSNYGAFRSRSRFIRSSW